MDKINILVTNLKTAYASKRLMVSVPQYNKLTIRVLMLMRDLGFLLGVNLTTRSLSCILKYSDDGLPALRTLVQVSRPGSRVFASYKHLRSISKSYSLSNSFQVVILSTPIGIVTHSVAIANRVGGEVLMTIN